MLRGIIVTVDGCKYWKEIFCGLFFRTGHATEGLLEVTGDGVDVTKKLYVNNVERYYHENEHFMGQVSMWK